MRFQSHPILRDFDQFLGYLEAAKKIELTKNLGHLQSADLQKIDGLMHRQTRSVPPKSRQPAYAVLNAFYYIARTGNLFRVEKKKGAAKLHLSLDPSRLADYRRLPPDEQYFFLLETFWCFVDWKEAFDTHFFFDGNKYLELLENKPGQKITFKHKGSKLAGKIPPLTSGAIAEIFEAFGWIDLVWDRRFDHRSAESRFPYEAMSFTELGAVVLPVLLEKRDHDRWSDLNSYGFDDWEEDEEDPDEIDYFGMDLEDLMEFDESMSDGLSESLAELLADSMVQADGEGPGETTFAAAFLPVLKGLEIEKSWYPIVRPFVAGQYMFHIELSDKVYRVIGIDGEASLDELHLVIQKLFRFDNDHLYAFFMDGNRWSRQERYFDPRDLVGSGRIQAHEVRIGELGLYLGQRFLYLFDFGDEWQFLITLLEVRPQAAGRDGFELIESVGKAPKQY